MRTILLYVSFLTLLLLSVQRFVPESRIGGEVCALATDSAALLGVDANVPDFCFYDGNAHARIGGDARTYVPAYTTAAGVVYAHEHWAP